RQLYLRALAINERALGPSHVKLTAALWNLADVHQSWGDFASALPYVERAAEIRERTLGTEHHNYLACRVKQADLLQLIGEYDDARLLYEDVAERGDSHSPGGLDPWTWLGLAEIDLASGNAASARARLDGFFAARESWIDIWASEEKDRRGRWAY